MPPTVLEDLLCIQEHRWQLQLFQEWLHFSKLCILIGPLRLYDQLLSLQVIINCIFFQLHTHNQITDQKRNLNPSSFNSIVVFTLQLGEQIRLESSYLQKGHLAKQLTRLITVEALWTQRKLQNQVSYTTWAQKTTFSTCARPVTTTHLSLSLLDK